jgi:MFS transporter, PPP family, 3-phenylpropionic acid transporter
MFRLKLQYFIAFAVNGCLVPFVPLYLKQMHLDAGQIGSIMGAASFAVVLSPVLVTLIADAHMEARRVLAAVQFLTAASLLVTPLFGTFLAILTGWLLVSIVQVPINPLQDGINFAIQQKRREQGLKEMAYHRIRVWGTIGFLAPGLLLYLLVRRRDDVTIVLYMAAVFALAGGINTLLLPRVERGKAAVDRKPPTLQAAKMLFGRRLIVFCLASFLLQMAAACYYSFYPIYLSDGLHIPREWAGMIMNIGVVFEILYMLSFGRILKLLGPRWFLILFSGVMGLRMALLAAFPNPVVAIGTQALHGAIVLLLTVAPVVLVNSVAGDGYRHSMQGLYTMLVLGGGRIVGNFLSGPIAGRSYQAAYWWAFGLVAAATLLVYVGYWPVESSSPQTAQK